MEQLTIVKFMNMMEQIIYVHNVIKIVKLILFKNNTFAVHMKHITTVQHVLQILNLHIVRYSLIIFLTIA
jgi:hypothetical protein